MTIEAHCSGCGFCAKISATYRGKEVTCPKCRQPIPLEEDIVHPENKIKPTHGWPALKAAGIVLVMLGIVAFAYWMYIQRSFMSAEASLFEAQPTHAIVTKGRTMSERFRYQCFFRYSVSGKHQSFQKTFESKDHWKTAFGETKSVDPETAKSELPQTIAILVNEERPEEYYQKETVRYGMGLSFIVFCLGWVLFILGRA